MLTLSQMGDLARSLRDEHVLSVYIDGRVADPAARRAWRTRLDEQLRDIRRSLEEAPRDERHAFDHAAAHLRHDLLRTEGAIGAPAWVAFAAGDGVRYAGPLPTAVVPHVAWRTGPRLAPQVLALARSRPVIVAVASGAATRLYRCRDGTVEKLPVVESEWKPRAPRHMGEASSQRFHPGTRGATATEENERRRLTALQRMASATAERLAVLARPEAWVVLGGTPEPLRILLKALPQSLGDRVRTLASLHDGATEAEVRRAADEGATLLRAAHDLATVNELVELYGADGLATVGADPTRRALDDGAVQALYLTQGFATSHAEEAEQAIRAALGQHAAIEQVTGEAAERLDREGGGIGARLRFARDFGTAVH